MATIEQYRRKKERLKAGACPGCGQAKPANHFYCHDCMEDRGDWHGMEVAPRFPRRLPVAPLCAAVREWLKTNMAYDGFGNPLIESSIAPLGLIVRRYNEWSTGRAYWVGVELADRVLTGLGLDWLDVWTREEHPRFAACLDAIDALGEAPADGFCPECCEPVATLNGTCPWHPVPVVVEPYLESEAA